jgi:hypothetical protein
LKKIFLVVVAVMLASPALAWNNNNNSYNNGTEESNHDQEERQREIDRNNEYPYESNTGTRYKYDLNNPVDKIKYDVDPAAQVLDSVNPMIEIDRDLGQYGGGAE